MRLFGTRRARLTVGLAVVAIAAMIAAGIAWRLGVLAGRLGPMIAHELAEQLGREVAIGRVRTWPLGRVVLQDVRIAAERRLAGGELARVAQVVVRYRWPALLKGGDPLAAVDRVDLYRPALRLIRDRSGVWNVARLRLKRRDRPSPFRGTVRIHAGTCVVVDHAARHVPAPARFRVEGIDARIAWADPRRLTFTAAGQVRDHGPVRLAGSVAPQKPLAWQVSLAAETGRIDYWTRYFFGDDREWAVTAASTRLEATFASPAERGARPHLQLVATGRDVTLRVRPVRRPLHAAEATLTYSPEATEVHAEGRLAGIPLTFAGSLRMAPSQRRAAWLHVRLHSEHLALAEARQLLPELELPAAVRAVAPFRLTLTAEGPPAGLRWWGEVATPRVDLEQGTLAGLHAAFRWENRLLTLTEFAGSLAGGTVRGRGWLDLRDSEAHSLYLAGRTEEVQLAQLEPLRARQIAGVAAGEFVVSGPVAHPETTFAGVVREARLGRLRVAEIAHQIRHRGEVLEVLSATARDPRGTLTARGTIADDGVLDLRVRAAGLSLGSLWSEEAKAPPEGRLWLIGRIVGTTEQPALDARAELYGVRWDRWDAEYVRAELSATRDQISLRRLEVRRPPGTLQVGELLAERISDRDWRLHGEGRATDFAIAGLLALAGVAPERLRAEPIAGTIPTATFSVAGTVRQPEATFTARARGVAVRGLTLGDVSLTASYSGSDRTARFAAATAPERQPRLDVRGSLTLPAADQRPATGRDPLAGALLSVMGTLDGAGLPPLLRRLAPEWQRAVIARGTLDRIEFAVAGEIRSPAITGRVVAQTLEVNGEPVGPLQAEFAARGERVLIPRAELGIGSGSLRLANGVWLGQPPRARSGTLRTLLAAVAGEIAIADLSLPMARRLLAGSPLAFPDPDAPPRREDERPSPEERFRTIVAQLPRTLSGSLSGSIALPAAGPLSVDAPDSAWEVVRAARWSDPAARVRLAGHAIQWDEPSTATTPARAAVGAVEASLEAEYAGGAVRIADLTLFQPQREMRLQVSGEYVESTTPDQPDTVSLDYRARNLDLALFETLPLADVRESLAALRPLDGLVSIEGTATGDPANLAITLRLDLAGRTGQPHATVAGLPVAELVIADLRLDPARAELAFDDARVVMQHQGHLHTLFARGRIPFRWHEPHFPEHRPQSFVVHLPPQEADLLEVIAATGSSEGSPPVAAKFDPAAPPPTLRALFRQFTGILGDRFEIDGRVRALVAIEGTRAAPRVSGSANLTSDRLHLAMLRTTVEQFAAEVQFDGDRITLARFEGRHGGFFRGGGTILLGSGPQRPQVQLSLELADFQIGEGNARAVLRTVAGPTDPTEGALLIRTVTPRGRPGSRPTLQIAGTVLVPTARIPTEWRVEAREPWQVPWDPVFDVRFVAGERVAIQNLPVLRLDVAGGVEPVAVHVHGRLSQLRVDGLIPVRGQLLLPPSRFNVRGDVRVRYDAAEAQRVAGIPPLPIEIDWLCTTTLRFAGDFASGLRTYEVTISLRGRPSAAQLATADPAAVEPEPGLAGGGLTIEVSSHPPLPSAQLVSLLEARLGLGTQGLASSEGGEALATHFQRALFSAVVPGFALPIEQAIQRTFGLDLFTIEVGLDEPVQLWVGRRLFSQLYASLIQDLSATAQQPQRRIWEIYYRASPRFRIGFRDEQPENRRMWFLSGTFTFR